MVTVADGVGPPAPDVDLVGVMNAVAVAIPHLKEFGSIIVTGSTAAMMPNTVSDSVMGPGGAGFGLEASYQLLAGKTRTCLRQPQCFYGYVTADHWIESVKHDAHGAAPEQVHDLVPRH